MPKSTVTLDRNTHQFVLLDGETFATTVDHVRQRLGCWQLVGDKWVEPKDDADAMFNGKIIYGATAEYPPVPEDAMT